jgi:hypothetical protein
VKSQEGQRYKEVCDACITTNVPKQPEWEEKILCLSNFCPYRKCRYFLALFVCYLVARNAGRSHDEAIRINLPQSLSRGFQLRGIAKHVANVSALYDIDIGSTSADCLNGTPAKAGNVRNLNEIRNTNNEIGNQYFQSLIVELSDMATDKCREVLATYIQVMRKVRVSAPRLASTGYSNFLSSILVRMSECSDYGNSAVALVGACACVLSDDDCYVHVGKTNDPDRRYPCDVSVIRKDTNEVCLSYEVKDKQVTPADLKLSLLKMERESFRPVSLRFCLFKGIDGDPKDAISQIAGEGYTPILFTSALDFIAHSFILSGLDENSFAGKVSSEYERVYSLITV